MIKFSIFNFQFSEEETGFTRTPIRLLRQSRTRLIQPDMVSGFTIIEALVSVIILTMALVPVVNTISSFTGISTSIKDNLIAANLAQEGVEVVRAIRDRNWYLDPDGLPPFPLTAGLIGTWRVQWDSDAPIAVGANPPLLIDGNGVYNYATGTASNFRRRIIITDADGANPNRDMRVVSEVTWSTKGGITSMIQVESHLFNWR